MDKDFWRNKKVLITGHTGFKGSWLTIWLNDLGAKVFGYSLSPDESICLFHITNLHHIVLSTFDDICNFKSLKQATEKIKPDIVFHLAAQPLVRLSYQEPIQTFSTNIIGTANILEICKNIVSVKAVINVTSDKCYENKEWLWGYRENDPMGGHDPYSASKGCSEILTNSYLKSYYLEQKIGLATCRAGNVIGGGDWSSDRLIPDILNGFRSNKSVKVRYPYAIRPWQHVIEPLSGYIMLAEYLYKEPTRFSGAWNFGPRDEDAREVLWVVKKMAQIWGDGALWEIDKFEHDHEANFLKLDTSKARQLLNWHPQWNLQKSLNQIISWDNAWVNGEDMHKKCLEQISEYTNIEGIRK